jgi:sulfur-carrier protein adenylyltransferase/sulfurtransferase
MDYSRQTILPQWGEAAQQKLRDSKILVVGAGGLGSAILPYLAAAGVGNLGIIDGDRIEASNLPRQVIYSESQIGSLKAEVASAYLQSRYSELSLVSYTSFLNETNASEIIQNFDLLDATDDIPTRYLIDEACLAAGIPWVYGSIHQFEGQVSVFNFNNGPTYRDLFPTQSRSAVSCSEAGVLGTTVGLIGMLQANEALKIIAGFGTSLSGKLLIYNLLNNSQHIFEIEKKKESPSIENSFRTELISIADAIQSQAILLDVRSFGELPEVSHKRYVQIPLAELADRWQNLDLDRELVIFCQSGARSAQAAELLNGLGFRRIKVIKGGAKELAKKIDL